MEEKVLVSRKINLGKKFRKFWMIISVLLAVVIAISFVKYSTYKKAQDFAVETVTALADGYFDEYKDNESELIKKLYNFYNPVQYNVPGYNNYDQVQAAHKADRELAELMNITGYECYNGSEYFEYIGYIDYARGNTVLLFIAWALLAFCLLCVHLWYLADQKKQIVIDGNKLICKNGNRTVKEFLVNDVKSVEFAAKKGIKICGTSINYRINLVENREEIKSAIIDTLSTISRETATAQSQDNSADSIAKFKELLDSGVITQEEFDAKKKQLLGL